jgi:hypothetical protein
MLRETMLSQHIMRSSQGTGVATAAGTPPVPVKVPTKWQQLVVPEWMSQIPGATELARQEDSIGFVYDMNPDGTVTWRDGHQMRGRYHYVGTYNPGTIQPNMGVWVWAWAMGLEPSRMTEGIDQKRLLSGTDRLLKGVADHRAVAQRIELHTCQPITVLRSDSGVEPLILAGLAFGYTRMFMHFTASGVLDAYIVSENYETDERTTP